jgi:hypothetical protein
MSIEYYDRGNYFENLYIRTDDYGSRQKMIQNYTEGSKNGNVDCLTKLIEIYSKEFNNKKHDFKKTKFVKFIKWNKIAVDKYKHINSMLNLANYYNHFKDNKNFIKYSLMANTSESIYSVAKYYMDLEKNKENLTNTLIYLAKANELGHLQAYYDLKYYYIYEFNNDVHLYNVLIDIKDPPTYLKIKINKLEKNVDICSFKNKKRLFSELNNHKDCIICYENKLNIILNCGHEICVDCYYKVDTCYYKCKKSNDDFLNAFF